MSGPPNLELFGSLSKRAIDYVGNAGRKAADGVVDGVKTAAQKLSANRAYQPVFNSPDFHAELITHWIIDTLKEQGYKIPTRAKDNIEVNVAIQIEHQLKETPNLAFFTNDNNPHNLSSIVEQSSGIKDVKLPHGAIYVRPNEPDEQKCVVQHPENVMKGTEPYKEDLLAKYMPKEATNLTDSVLPDEPVKV